MQSRKTISYLRGISVRWYMAARRRPGFIWFHAITSSWQTVASSNSKSYGFSSACSRLLT